MNVPAMGVIVGSGYTTQQVDDDAQFLTKPYELAALQSTPEAVSSKPARPAA